MKFRHILENLKPTATEPAPRVVNGLAPAMAFLGFALLWSQLGYLAPDVSRPIGGLLWLAALALIPIKNRWLWLTVSAILLFNPWGAVHQGEGLLLLALLPWAAGLWGKRWMGAALMAATGGFIWRHFPGLWVPLDDLVSNLAHGLTGADLSASASGLPLMLLAACFPLAALIIGRRPFAALMALGGVILTLPVYWLLQRSLESSLHHWGWHSLHDAFTMQWAMAGLLGVVLAVWGLVDPPLPPLDKGGMKGSGKSDHPRPPLLRGVTPRYAKWLVPILVLIGALLVGLAPRVGKPDLDKQIVLLNKGYLDWKTPKYGVYGAHSAGMFGLIPDYLHWRGFQVSVQDSLTLQSLEKAGVVVIINLIKSLSPDEEEALRRFVENGGSLLLLGDHTGLSDIREPSNHLTSPYGIELNFDTAKPLRTGWAGCLECAPHPLTAGWNLDRASCHESEGRTQIWVGASLKVAAPARPVIVGRETWSDAGNPNNPKDGYLGDFRYTVNERLGDMPLVAEANAGRGKILVFGDTSTLQNGALVRAGDWVIHLFRYLLSPVEAPSGILKIIGVLLLVAGLVFWGFSGAGEMALALCSLALFAAGTFSQVMLLSDEDDTNQAWTEQAPPRALLDHSHRPRAPLNQVSESGHWGLQNALMRSGFLPRIVERWDRRDLDQAKILVEIAPSEPFSKNELRDVTSFMQRGGLVVVSCGKEEFDGSRGLLDLVGVQPVYVPLGPAEFDTVFTLPVIGDTSGLEAEQPVHIVFHEAWEIKQSAVSSQQSGVPPLIKGGRGDLSGGDKIRTMLYGYGKPLVTFTPVGRGGLLFIPDTDFLMNRNLESPSDKVQEGNILFVRHVLRELAGGE